MYSAYILLSLVLAAVVYGCVEFSRHQRHVLSIPIRIHVNGTRGKSSVTRLIGAGLRAGGIATITKVTGTYPRLILEDGSEIHIYRRGDANILEQLSIMQFASERNARAIVIECMALEPQYQHITEHQMIHATIGVITNVRLDHVDIMGHTTEEIATVLGETIPERRHLFTAEYSVTEQLRNIATTKETEVHVAMPDAVSSDEMRRFSYIEHRENVALALDVCTHLGIDRSVALAGMFTATPDAGVLKRYTVEAFKKRLTFYNAFAANDPDSTFFIWKKLKEESGFDGARVVLLNTRQDRMDRARQLAEMVGQRLNSEMDCLMLIGQCPDVVKGMSVEYGVDPARIVSIGWTTPESVFEHALSVTNPASTIVGIGNMGGMGAAVAEYFERRSISGNG